METTEAATQISSQQASADIRGVLLPIEQTHLLLPNVTVAEVIGFRDAEPLVDAPGWLTGTITWRQRKVPVVAFEFFLNNRVSPPGHRARIALCHNLRGNPGIAYIGIICQSIPRLARVNASTITEADPADALLPEMTLRHLYYGNEDVWIPDIEALGEAAEVYLSGASC